ncbi:DUF1361 domain-containing protein [Ruminococcaceae bacterium OttesenSCG-928-A16]|nr:DUF1361 domain-containing protein [Ruminococcaceae bacterium OttesenSCG-928-A16]
MKWYERLSQKLNYAFMPRTVRLTAALLSAWVVMVLVTTFYENHLIARNFLLWNVFLAATPLFFALLLTRRAAKGRRGPLGVVWWGLWLVLYPNSPYMLTDFIHVKNYTYEPGFDLTPDVISWFGLVHIIAAVALGCAFGYLSLYLLHNIVRGRLGQLVGWLFVGAASALSGLGIYIGRFMRFNTWDIASRPMALLGDVLDRLSRRTAWLCFLFAAMVLAGYLLFYFCFDSKENTTPPTPKAKTDMSPINSSATPN